MMLSCRIACEREESRFAPVTPVTLLELPWLIFCTRSSTEAISNSFRPIMLTWLTRKYVLLRVFSRVELGSLVQQVVELAAINFVERNEHSQSSVGRLCELVEDVVRCKDVETVDLLAVVVVADHGVGFSAAGLSVGEARDFGSLESEVDERLDGAFIDLVSLGYVEVVAVLVEDAVEDEAVFFDVLGEIDLLPSSTEAYFSSCTVSSRPWQRAMSISLLASSFLFKGRFRITTLILGTLAIQTGLP